MMEQNQNYGMTFKDVILKVKEFKALIVSRLFFVISFSISFGLLVALLSFCQNKTHEANLSFVIEDSQSSNLGGLSGVASQFGVNFGGSSNGAFNQGNIKELIFSRRVVEAALLDYGVLDGKNDLLINHHIKINNFKEKWFDTVDPESLVFTSNRQDFSFEQDSILSLAWASLVNSNLQINNIDESSVISLSCKSKNNEFAIILSENLIVHLEKFYILFQAGKALNTLSFIESRADSILLALESSEVDYANYKDSNFGVTRAKGLLQEIQLKRNVEILNVMYTEVIKNLEISKFTLMNQTPLINVIDSPKLPLVSNSSSIVVNFILGLILGLILSSFKVILSSVIKQELS